MIAKLKMAPFIATFGMSTIVYGINCLYFAKKPNNSQPIGGIRNDLTVLSSFKVFGQFLFSGHRRHCHCRRLVSAQQDCVWEEHLYRGRQSGSGQGIRYKCQQGDHHCIYHRIHVCRLAGILEVARTGGANSAYGNAYEFDAISSCVVGGVSLSGGVGKVSGVIIGVLIFTFISYGLAYIGVNSNWQLIVKGLIICSAVALDMRKNS